MYVKKCGKGQGHLLFMRLGYERYGFGAQVRAWVAIFFLFNRNAFSNMSSVLKMTATVYERDTLRRRKSCLV